MQKINHFSHFYGTFEDFYVHFENFLLLVIFLATSRHVVEHVHMLAKGVYFQDLKTERLQLLAKKSLP